MKLNFLLAALVSICCLSMTSIHHHGILSENDLQLESLESTRPALSAALGSEPYWRSFNEWHCFSTKIVQPYCAETDDGKSQIPTLRVSDGDGKLYEFSLDPEPGINCGEILNAWVALLSNQRGFCVYSAYLQDIDDNHELWVVDKVKSYSGYWNYRQGIDEGPN